MANAVTVATTNGPLQVNVTDFKDAAGNATVAPEVPNFVVSGPATIAPQGDPQTAIVTLAGTPGIVSVEARYSAFTMTGTITVEAGPAVTATLNISA
jgi:hypothetical protein